MKRKDPTRAQNTVTMVQLDPISGPFKDVGDLSIGGVQFAVDEVNAAGLFGEMAKEKQTVGYRHDLSFQVHALSTLMSRASGVAIRDGGR